MAGSPTFNKRQKELARRQKQLEKIERRRQRKIDKQNGIALPDGDDTGEELTGAELTGADLSEDAEGAADQTTKDLSSGNTPQGSGQ